MALQYYQKIILFDEYFDWNIVDVFVGFKSLYLNYVYGL